MLGSDMLLVLKEAGTSSQICWDPPVDAHTDLSIKIKLGTVAHVGSGHIFRGQPRPLS